jgi:beta-glucuronidase
MLYPQANGLRSVVNLSGFWQFSLDEQDAGDEGRWFEGLPSSRPIAVPGSWNEQFQDTMFYMGTAWYETEFHVPPEWKGKRVVLRVGAAGYWADAWLDGEPLGSHEGSALPFEFDVTRRTTPGARHRLTLKLDNRLGKDTIPPGVPEQPEQGDQGGGIPTEGLEAFASVLPEIQMLPLLMETRKQYPDVPFDFLPYGGINRPVKLYATAKTYIDKVRVRTKPRKTTASVSCDVTARGKATSVVAVLSRGNKEFKAEAVLEDGRASLEIKVPRPELWSPDNPNLYHLEIRLFNKSKLVDEYHLDTGIRSIEVTDKNILLNGEPIYLNGVCKHEDFPVIGRGLSEPVIVKDFSLMKWLGANSFRTSHYPYSEELMMLADRLGFLVIDEMPTVGLDYKMYNDEVLEKCDGILTDLIERDANHPSVIMWSIANEPEGFTESAGEFFGKLADRARELDPTRPVTLATMHMPVDYTFAAVDVIAINRYYGWYMNPGRIDLAEKILSDELDAIYAEHKKPIIVTEFGADAMEGLHSDPPEIYTEEYQADLIEAYIKVIRSKDFTVGEHVWNLADFKTPQQYTRTVFNRKGVFTRDRRPKMAAHLLRRLWRGGEDK